MNKRIEFFAYVSLIGCITLIPISLTILSGNWAMIGSVAAAMPGILSGGLFGLSISSKNKR